MTTKTLYGPPKNAKQYREYWARVAPHIPYGECWCGCGGRTAKVTHQDTKKMQFIGEYLRYIFGHQGNKEKGKPVSEEVYAAKKEGREAEEQVATVCVRENCDTKLNRYTIRAQINTCSIHTRS